MPSKEEEFFSALMDLSSARSRIDGPRIHFICRMKTRYGCKVTAAVTKEDNMLVRITGEHIHDTDIAVKKVREKENDAIEEAARNPTVSPRSVLANLTANLMTTSPLSVNHLSNSKSFTKRIQRERNKVLACAKVPKTWGEMKIIPEELQLNAAGEQFLICNKQPKANEEKLVQGFCSPTAFETLDASDVWFGDGTFDVAKPTMFTQLFIIMAKSINGKTVPCGFFLLPSKEYESYRTMFSELRERGVAPPRLFYSDFGSGITKAFAEIYPEATIYCCDAHFKRTVRKNMQKYHLITGYNSYNKF